jgi:exodeoxyribonuclease VII small subunit
MTAMSRRKSPDTGETPPAPSFEEALAGLEAVVAAMEEGSLPLEDLVARYEQGTALLQRCETILAGARERIELITLRNRNTPADTPSGHAPEPTPGDEEPFEQVDDDIRLF